MIGKEMRINDLLNNKKRALIIELDTGLYGLDLSNINELLEKMPLDSIDGIVLSPGLATKYMEYFTHKGGPSLIIRGDWTNAYWDEQFILAKERIRHVLTCNAESAIKTGATALVGSIFLGSYKDEDEGINLKNLRNIAQDCVDLQLPLIIECYPIGPRINSDNFIAAAEMGSRMMIELGADIVAVPALGSSNNWRNFIGCTEDKPVFYTENRRSNLSINKIKKELDLLLKSAGNGLIINGFIPDLLDNIKTLVEKIKS